jgi:hypothetical protein
MTKMSTSEITTAEVVDSPTPLAPPAVVYPHEQLTCGTQTQHSRVGDALANACLDGLLPWGCRWKRAGNAVADVCLDGLRFWECRWS